MHPWPAAAEWAEARRPGWLLKAGCGVACWQLPGYVPAGGSSHLEHHNATGFQPAAPHAPSHTASTPGLTQEAEHPTTLCPAGGLLPLIFEQQMCSQGSQHSTPPPMSYSAAASSCTDLVHAGQDQWVAGLVLQGPWRCRVPGSLLLLLLSVQGKRGRQLAVRKWGAPGHLECLLQGTGCSPAWPGQEQLLRAGKAPKCCMAVGAFLWRRAMRQHVGHPAH